MKLINEKLYETLEMIFNAQRITQGRIRRSKRGFHSTRPINELMKKYEDFFCKKKPAEVKLKQEGYDNRKRFLYLTPKGKKVYESMKKIKDR